MVRLGIGEQNYGNFFTCCAQLLQCLHTFLLTLLALQHKNQDGIIFKILMSFVEIFRRQILRAKSNCVLKRLYFFIFTAVVRVWQTSELRSAFRSIVCQIDNNDAAKIAFQTIGLRQFRKKWSESFGQNISPLLKTSVISELQSLSLSMHVAIKESQSIAVSFASATRAHLAVSYATQKHAKSIS